MFTRRGPRHAAPTVRASTPAMTTPAPSAAADAPAPTAPTRADPAARHIPAAMVDGLVKAYPDPAGGRLHAVDQLSFEVERGEVFALLGPNGAGKTTTLEILEGLTNATAGEARVLGLDVASKRRALKQRIGVQLQASSYFEYLTLGELLRLFGSFYDRHRDPDELLDRVGLLDKRRAFVGELSGGQAQRFSIVGALVNDPEILFLDEPTTGLDPQARRNLWDLIRSINDDGTTVVLTTHYLEEAELLADRVAIVDHGRLVALDTPVALIGALEDRYRVSFRLSTTVDRQPLEGLPGVTNVTSRVNGAADYQLAVSRPQDTVPALFTWARDLDLDLQDVRIDAPSLEDVFLARTGTRLRD